MLIYLQYKSRKLIYLTYNVMKLRKNAPIDKDYNWL